jgi:hypothetical protein
MSSIPSSHFNTTVIESVSDIAQLSQVVTDYAQHVRGILSSCAQDFTPEKEVDELTELVFTNNIMLDKIQEQIKNAKLSKNYKVIIARDSKFNKVQAIAILILGITFEKKHCWELHAMAPAYWNLKGLTHEDVKYKAPGAETSVLQLAICLAQQANVESMHLLAANSAISLYERFGFKKVQMTKSTQGLPPSTFKKLFERTEMLLSVTNKL